MNPGHVPPMAGHTETAAAFIRAAQMTDRQALNRYVAAHGRGLSEDARRALREAFLLQRPLLDVGLHALALQQLAHARGPRVAHTTWMEWPSSRYVTCGRSRTDSWAEYGRRHMEWRSCTFSKDEAPVYSPTTNPMGRRSNANTVCIHALHLDADGVGTWDTLIRALVAHGLAFLSHESASHTPEVPKFRVILPLTQPFSTVGQDGALRWRLAYGAARVLFGAIGQLSGWGFDPTTDAPQHPWYPAVRRDVQAPMRAVYQTDGATLDLDALLRGLPSVPRMGGGKTKGGPNHGSRTGEPSLLQHALEASGMLGRHLGNGKFTVLCPWNELHTAPLSPGAAPTSSTVLFPSAGGLNLGHLYCSHAACGSRSAGEVLAALPAFAVAHARALHGPTQRPPRVRFDTALSCRLPGLLHLDRSLPR